MAVKLSELRRLLLAEESAVRFRAKVKEIAYPPPPPSPPDASQQALWRVDAQGLPPRPWRISPGATFDCTTLGAKGLMVRTCVARQVATEAQRTNQTDRGQGTDYPSCDSLSCTQGRGIRMAMVWDAGAKWVGAGLHKRFSRGMERGRTRRQESARMRQRAVGLLEVVRTMDESHE